MAEIITAKSAGFCFGVQRAVETVYEEVKKGGPIYTYGPIIHNEEVVADLEKKGVHVITSDEELADIHGGTIITRSHGISREEDEKLRATGAKCVDATCPFVKRIHRIVEENSAEGYEIVIIGNPVHPEVRGIMGWSSVPVTVIENTEQAREFIEQKTPGQTSASDQRNICVVSQTTFNANKFEEIIAILTEKGYNVRCMNTICNATHERQTEAKAIASKADIMIVIGGRSSSNSAKLYEICKRECANTYFIQTWRDLNLSPAGNEQIIGITAGASTPKNIIEEVQNYVRADF
ncbi:MAG: 4-hydroxy-3-methylbut-2-enyl diphosphate reductase [Lachnospiraceae bacterium]|nr:4-hydroxy-3-methylbut-2-enyl diphosphate reductase [Lachnospiraceae bacterium]